MTLRLISAIPSALEVTDSQRRSGLPCSLKVDHMRTALMMMVQLLMNSMPPSRVLVRRLTWSLTIMGIGIPRTIRSRMVLPIGPAIKTPLLFYAFPGYSRVPDLFDLNCKGTGGGRSRSAYRQRSEGWLRKWYSGSFSPG